MQYQTGLRRQWTENNGRKRGFTQELRGRGEQYREPRCRGVYQSGTAVCAAQLGVSSRQSSGTVPLSRRSCTIFLSGTGAVTNQSVDLIIYFK